MKVGISIGIAMAGEMFPAGNNSRISRPLDPTFAECNNLMGVCAKGTIADHGILGIGVYVKNGSEVDVDPRQAELDGSCVARLVSEARIAPFADARSEGKMGERRRQPVGGAAFLVNGNKRRRIRKNFPQRAAK